MKYLPIDIDSLCMFNKIDNTKSISIEHLLNHRSGLADIFTDFRVYQTEYNGQKFYGHYGFYGTYIGYSPKSNTIISYYFSQPHLNFNKDVIINQLISEFQNTY